MCCHCALSHSKVTQPRTGLLTSKGGPSLQHTHTHKHTHTCRNTRIHRNTQTQTSSFRTTSKAGQQDITDLCPPLQYGPHCICSTHKHTHTHTHTHTQTHTQARTQWLIPSLHNVFSSTAVRQRSSVPSSKLFKRTSPRKR